MFLFLFIAGVTMGDVCVGINSVDEAHSWICVPRKVASLLSKAVSNGCVVGVAIENNSLHLIIRKHTRIMSVTIFPESKDANLYVDIQGYEADEVYG